MAMKVFKVTATFTQEVLGAVAKDQNVYASFIASKAALTDDELAQELDTVQNAEERGWTGFHTLPDGTPIFYDYVVKGFFKDACSMLRRDAESKSAKMKAFKKIIDGMVFVFPRQIPLMMPEGGKMGMLERPLRAETAQGPRVALARSDSLPAGTKMEFLVKVLAELDRKTLEEWLNYGQFRGFGQWRNGGYGTFTYTLEEMPINS